MAPIRTVPTIREFKPANPESRRNPKPPRGYKQKRVISARDAGAMYKGNYEGVHDGPGLYHYPLPLPVPEELRPVDPRGPPLTLDDFECLRPLGDGSNGQVLLVRTRGRAASDGAKVFALKATRRKHLRRWDLEDYAARSRERTALVNMDWNPFITGILDTFYDARNVYMLLEHSAGGTLSALLRAGALPLAQTRFYFANIVCALEFLDTYGIVNGDLKPVNILVGADGYLSLCDFDGAERIPEAGESGDRAVWLSVGTLEYLAPESISLDGQPADFSYGPKVDWWAAGTILCQMATGAFPFDMQPSPSLSSPAQAGRGVGDVDEQKLWERMMAGPSKWANGSRLGRKLKALILGLLTVNVNKRLGLQGVMQHPWLASVDWTKMRRKRYLPPALGVPASELLHCDRQLNPKHFPGLRFAD
ncbi:kinase-like domain-containing protein [Mycena vulgaris]|nr:kinase-like domain-containing protein [Mycena vulgaris]